MPQALSKTQYDRFGREYHAKRLSRTGAFYNDHLDLPAMDRLLRGKVKGKRVLDLGCGTGLFTRRLRRRGARVCGMDQSKTMIGIARTENPGIPFCVGHAARTRFSSGSFDIAVSGLMAHYLKNLKPLFREVFRLLKPGGLWVFSFHHPFNEVLDIHRRGKRVWAEAGPYFHNDSYVWTMGNMRLVSYHHSFEQIFESLSGCGFVVERLLEPRPSFRARPISPKDHRMTSAYPFFCAVRARKGNGK